MRGRQPGMAGQGLPAARRAGADKVCPVALMQPAPTQVLRVSAEGGERRAGPGVEQIAAEPQMRIERLDIQRRQCLAAFCPRGDWQLMLGQVREFAVQPIMAARPQPLRSVLAVAVLRAEVEFDRQFQVVHPIAVAQQHVQFAQRVPGTADRQVGGQQLHTRRLLHRKLPQALVVQAQAPGT